jgi:hypothetical protein
MRDFHSFFHFMEAEDPFPWHFPGESCMRNLHEKRAADAARKSGFGSDLSA